MKYATIGGVNISIPKKEENLHVLMRRIGYAPSRNRYGEQSFVRRARGGEFPRFHIYSEERESELLLNLHLDQKKPSYAGSRAHGGEHEGPALEAEVARIKSILV